MRWIAAVVVVCACYRGSTDSQESRPPPPPASTFAAAPPTVTAPGAPSACARDQVFETICGGVTAIPTAGATCGPTGDLLVSFGRTHLAITTPSHGHNDPARRDFTLDDDATADWKTDLRTNHGVTMLDGYCCYSRCTQLTVAANAPALVAPRGYHLGERCVPPPSSGTSQPASSAPSCPAALLLDGKLSPFRRVDPANRPQSVWWYRGDACCYQTLVRDQVPNMGHCPTCKCAAHGTLIATPDGERAIETLVAGDRVLTMHAGRLQVRPIASVSRTPARDHTMVVAQLANGRSVAMSPLHPTADGSRFGELTYGSRLGDATVLTIARVPYTGAFTYDILPASDSGSYVASGALVGSTLR